jgi:hypothetical protein
LPDKNATVVDYGSMAIVPDLKAVCKPSFKVDKSEGGIRLASARQVVEPHHPARLSSGSAHEHRRQLVRFQGL